MVTLHRASGVLVGCVVFGSVGQAWAASGATSEAAPSTRGHAHAAPYTAVPSHEFQLAPRWHDTPQLSVHFGLLQPVLFEGFNAAMDLRWGPVVASYSHGQGLNYSAQDGLGLNSRDKAAGVELRSPWTTGGGVGVVLLDELYVMVDVKAHRYEAAIGDDEAAYTTVSVGGELGYRLFAWRGLFVQPMLRFWPNVYTTLPSDEVALGDYTHEAKNLNLFMNVSLGWAFEI